MVPGIARALLAVDLPAAPANLAAGQGALGALALSRQIGTDDQMHRGFVDGGGENRVAQLHLADGRSFHIIKSSLSHFVLLLYQAFTVSRISSRPSLGPGTAPLTSSRFRSAST